VASQVAELLRELGVIFGGAGVRWYLFGAQAAILHGSARLSADVDVTVDVPEGSLSSLLATLSARGFSARIANPEAFAERTRVVPLVHGASGIPVDLVLAGPGLEERFFARIESFEVEGVRVPVASAEDMLVMKILAGREKDRADAAAIAEARMKELDLAYVRGTLRALEEALDRRDLLSVLEALVEGAGS
jgi:hypothetical protein